MTKKPLRQAGGIPAGGMPVGGRNWDVDKWWRLQTSATPVSTESVNNLYVRTFNQQINGLFTRMRKLRLAIMKAV